jgi:hypothetical protein
MKILQKFIYVLLFITGFMPTYTHAQIGIIADYPLTLDLVDSTGSNGDMFLLGDIPPTPPSNGVELCTNGFSIFEIGGQDIQTPVITGFDLANFQLDVQFKPTAFVDGNEFPYYPIMAGGTTSAWIAILIDPVGRIGLKFNALENSIIWSGTVITISPNFQNAQLRYENGAVTVFINGALAISDNIPALISMNDDFNFSVTDFTTGLVFHGCIRNVQISSPQDIVFVNGFDPS